MRLLREHPERAGVDAAAVLGEEGEGVVGLARVRRAEVRDDRLGLPPTLARVLTAPIVRDFRQRFANAEVSIVEGLSATIQEWVQVGRVDVGVIYDLTYSPAIELSPLIEEALCLIGPGPERERCDVPLRQLPRYPLIMPARPNAIRMLVEARLAAIGLKANVTLEIDAIPAILELVAEGLGYAVLSERAAAPAAKVLARPIVRPALRSKLAIAVSAQRPGTPLQRAAIERIRALAPTVLVPDDAGSPPSRG